MIELRESLVDSQQRQAIPPSAPSPFRVLSRDAVL
jgi:hypothetical protein